MTRQLIDARVVDLDDGPNVRAKADPNLRRSIELHGVLQPITVCRRGKRLQVLYGHRRVAAARALKLRTIPAILERAPDDLPIRQLIENIDRQQLNPMDVARTLRAHLEANPGMTQAQLCRLIGRSSYYVSKKLALLDLDPEMIERIERHDVREDVALYGRMATTRQRNGRRRIIQGGRRRPAIALGRRALRPHRTAGSCPGDDRRRLRGPAGRPDRRGRLGPEADAQPGPGRGPDARASPDAGLPGDRVRR